MPNHFHTILEIVGATLVVAQNDVNNQNDVDIQIETVVQNKTAAPYEMVVQNDVNIQKVVVTPNENCECNTKGQPQGIAPTSKTIGEMVGAFESITTLEYIRGTKTIIGKHSIKNCGNVIIGNTLSEMNNRIS
jgi:hypothetical protein